MTKAEAMATVLRQNSSPNADVLDILRRVGEDERLRIAERARQRILSQHTAAHRAAEVEAHAVELLSGVAA